MGSPLYEGLAAELRAKVLSGELAPGERLPSEATLIAEHGVSRPTVRNALDLLEREGLIHSIKGRGRWVRDRDPIRWSISRPESNVRTDIVPNDAWSIDVREQGRVPSETSRRASIMEAGSDPRIAKRLQLADDALVWVRHRQRFVDDEIWMTADTHFPEELVSGTPIARPADVLPGTLAVLEQLGHGVVRHTDEIFCRAATAVEADLFGIAAGASMVETVRTRFAAGDRPVAVTITVAPGDRVVLVIEGGE